MSLFKKSAPSGFLCGSVLLNDSFGAMRQRHRTPSLAISCQNRYIKNQSINIFLSFKSELKFYQNIIKLDITNSSHQSSYVVIRDLGRADLVTKGFKTDSQQHHIHRTSWLPVFASKCILWGLLAAFFLLVHSRVLSLRVLFIHLTSSSPTR